MSNYDPSEPPTREITVGGKARVLAYPMLAVIKMRKKYAEFNWSFSKLRGAEFDEAYAKADIEERVQLAAVHLWAGLLHQDKKLDLDDVMWWVDFKNYEEILAKTTLALQDTIPVSKVEEESPLGQSPESRQTSTQSGQSADTISDLATTNSVN